MIAFDKVTIVRLWILKIVDTESPDWAASTYKGNVVIRATDERGARREATHRFHIASEKTSGGHVKANPWSQEALVVCEQYTGNEYSTTGNSGILFPQHEDILWRSYAQPIIPPDAAR
ncbi:MAG: hypothetical protein WD823_02460 [Sulfuricaulis sp.]|uniref:hypothetical protein n=1 Tax=Sulfuricaulis sp. TaxID=2003553 RepID=UPI0034A5BFD6